MPEIISRVIEWAVFVCVLWALFFLTFFLHEAGHAVGCMMASGDRDWRIRAGSGKRLMHTRRLTVKLLPFDGSFIPPENDGLNTEAKRVIMLSGGPAVSLILSAFLLFVKTGDVSLRPEVIAAGAAESLISIALFVNLFILIQSVLPVRYFYGEIRGFGNGRPADHPRRQEKRRVNHRARRRREPACGSEFSFPGSDP